MPDNRRLSWGDMDLRAIEHPDQVPKEFNLAAALLDRHIVEGRGSHRALVGPCGEYSYEQLYRLTNQLGNAMRVLGVQEEERVLLLLRDSPEFVAGFLAAMKIGAVAVGLNTFTHPSDYDFYLRHSRARLLIADAEFLPALQPFLWKHCLRAVISVRGTFEKAHAFEQIVPSQSSELDPHPTHKDQPAHWVYTSGSTGESKAVVHLHRNTLFSVEPHARHVVQMTPQDINFSVARLFFSYGLTNSLLMPLWVGGSSVLLPERPEPHRVVETIEQYQPTIFFSVPTSYGRMLRENLDLKKLSSIRLCVSAGEALPAPIYEHWLRETGLQIMDGVGSTEVGYIFLSNRPGDVKPGSSGKILPGFGARLVDTVGREVEDGAVGELWISSPSISAFYWLNSAASKKTFIGEWVRTGDQYVRNPDGSYTYLGRTDDLFKSGGIWVSPIQVESTLLEHPAVAEASVVAERDPEGLEKAVAYIVLKAGFEACVSTEEQLRQFTRERLAVYKCPKNFRFMSELPKTATGKIQRFKLRMQAEREGL